MYRKRGERVNSLSLISDEWLREHIQLRVHRANEIMQELRMLVAEQERRIKK